MSVHDSPTRTDPRTSRLTVAGRRVIPAPDAATANATAPARLHGLVLGWTDDTPQLRPLAGQLRIGRSLHADIRFEDASTSRRHALICPAEDGALVCDEGSLNGVYLNGRRVDGQHRARAGDTITVGLHELRLIELP